MPPGGGNPYAPPAPYGAPQQGYGQRPPGSVEYEFTPEENMVVTDLSSKMRFVGVISIVFGALVILSGFGACAAAKQNGVATGLGNVIQGVVMIIVGVWTRSAAASFQRIVDTEGNDIGNLMAALGHLRRIYGLQKTLILIALVLIGIAFVLGLVAAVFMVGRVR